MKSIHKTNSHEIHQFDSLQEMGDHEASEGAEKDDGRIHEHVLAPQADTHIKEHGLKIMSRTTGKPVEVKFGPQGGGMVPKNPFASLAQSRFAHAHPEKFGGQKGLKEWDTETNYGKIPKKSRSEK